MSDSSVVFLCPVRQTHSLAVVETMIWNGEMAIGEPNGRVMGVQ